MVAGMKWRRVGLWGMTSGQWCIGKIVSNGVPRYVLSKKGGDGLGWFDTANEAQDEAEKLSSDAPQ